MGLLTLGAGVGEGGEEEEEVKATLPKYQCRNYFNFDGRLKAVNVKLKKVGQCRHLAVPLMMMMIPTDPVRIQWNFPPLDRNYELRL